MCGGKLLGKHNWHGRDLRQVISVCLLTLLVDWSMFFKVVLLFKTQ